MSFSDPLDPRKLAAIAGVTSIVTNRALTNASITVSAIGRNVLPSMSCSDSTGR